MKFEIEVVGGNRFNEGWLAYVLGLPLEDDEAFNDGWTMAEETSVLAPVRDIMLKQPLLASPQYVVTHLAREENG